MDRLNFSLPDFTRVAWVSERARDRWHPRIKRIADLWPLIERWTVVRFMRSGALQSIHPNNLTTIQSWCLENNQDLVVVAQEGSTEFYGNAVREFDPSQPWNYRVYIGKNPTEFLRAWRRQDNIQIANLLGYPLCCAAFFDKYWQEEGWRDLTFPMVGFHEGIVDGSAMCNVLLRYIGLRAVFHLPCSFYCEHTQRVGETNFECMLGLGYVQEAEWLYEILNWPMQWSSLHGVAMITTPILKIVTSTDALPSHVQITKTGVDSPDEGQPIKIVTKDTWSDNGFSSREAMRGAHELLLSAVDKVLLEPGKVLDLGCGNGMLLKRLQDKYGLLEPVGVEIDKERAKNAKVPIIQTDIMDPLIYDDTYYQLTFLSLNRLKELNPDKRNVLLSRLRSKSAYVILYSYEVWNESEMSLDLQRHFDLTHIEKNQYAEAKILRPKVFTE